MLKYQLKKQRARDLAIDWQLNNAGKPGQSWQWCAEWAARWERIGRKYGLLKEFKENGII